MITDIEVEKIRAETLKLQSEMYLNNKKLKWFDVVIIISITLALVSVAKIII